MAKRKRTRRVCYERIAYKAGVGRRTFFGSQLVEGNLTEHKQVYLMEDMVHPNKPRSYVFRWRKAKGEHHRGRKCDVFVDIRRKGQDQDLIR